MHKHLEKQLAQATVGEGVDLPRLLVAISDYYAAMDRERSLRARSLELMSQELLALNQRIQRQSEVRFRGVFEQAADALLVADAEDRISRGNAAAAALLGLPAAALAGQSISAFLPGPVREGEQEVLCADGSRVPVEIRCTPLQLDDDTGALYSLRDISERQRVERERAAFTERLTRSNAELERFAYIASHDLQEPLRSIISFSGLLERRLQAVLDEDTRAYLRFVIEGGTRMHEMIRGLLELSRLDGQPPQPLPTDLAAVTASICQELSEAISAAGAVIHTGPLPTVTVDPVQIRQVLANLVGNALKFCGSVAPAIDIGVQAEAAGWHLVVADNGPGIAAEHRQEVFQLFRRLHAADRYPGTGMGLAICQRIVNAHGGRIWVEDSATGGAAFHLLLPQ